MHEKIKQHVEFYAKPNNLLALKSLAISVLIETIAVCLIYFNPNMILYSLGWLIHSFNSVRIFIQMHDMAHYSFFESIKLNNLFGRILGLITFFPFDAWKNNHNYHHMNFGNLEKTDRAQTIFFTKSEYENMSLVKKIIIRTFREPFMMFVFMIPFYWFFLNAFLMVKKGLFTKNMLSIFLSYVYVICSAYYFNFNLTYHIFSYWNAAIIAGILFHLQHSINIPYRKHSYEFNKDNAALEGSTYLDICFPLNIFTNGIEFHHIHHLNTKVPSYLLAKCHNSIDYAEWDNAGINNVGLGLAYESLFNVMLDEENNKLIGFDYNFFNVNKPNSKKE
jgi:omega-6 fatty acid desaturase (delta-12 desaturase)